ncbi:MAG: hypothetical protein QM767_04720 [Anaeromyxobacter sp.]
MHLPRRAARVAAALLLASCSAAPEAPAPPPAIRSGGPIEDAPQYLGVRLSGNQTPVRDTAVNRARCDWPEDLPFLGDDELCVLLTRDLVERVPDQARRRWMVARGLRELRQAALGNGLEAPGRRLAVEVILDTLNVPAGRADRLEAWLEDLLAAAVQERIALIVNVDTVNWMNARPDVWTAADAIETPFAGTAFVTWRNWGRQLRVGTPAPNLASPRFRGANAEVVRRLLPHLAAFRAALAPEDRWLYGGLVFGTEISVGVNHFHYRGGEAWLATDDEACDPGRPRKAGCPGPPPDGGPCAGYNGNQCPAWCDGRSPSMGVDQLGYAAARQLGLLGPDQAMTAAALDGVVADYVAFLAGLAAEAGLPEHKLVAHVGGICAPAGGPHRLGVGRSGSVVPGTSLYDGWAQRPRRLLWTALEADAAVSPLPWTSPEWRAFRADGARPAQDWLDALEATAGYGNNRMVIMANWEEVARDPGALAALRRALTAPAPSFCALSPTLDLGHAVVAAEGGGAAGVALRLSTNPGARATVRISTRRAVDGQGLLSSPDLGEWSAEPGQALLVAGAYQGPAWVQVVTEGCGGARRLVSPLEPLQAVAGAGRPVAGPWLFTRSEGGRRTFSWALGSPAGAVRALWLERTAGSAGAEVVPLDPARETWTAPPGWSGAVRLGVELEEGGARTRRLSADALD